VKPSLSISEAQNIMAFDFGLGHVCIFSGREGFGDPEAERSVSCCYDAYRNTGNYIE